MQVSKSRVVDGQGFILDIGVSATSGGNFDDGSGMSLDAKPSCQLFKSPSELRNPHNKANSLMVCRDDQSQPVFFSGNSSITHS